MFRNFILVAACGVLSLMSCTPDAGSARHSDTTGSAAGLEVSRSSAELRARRLADSAAALDSIFQRERAALNAEAQAMRALDRRTPEYESRWETFRARSAAAEQLRARRDSLRAAGSAAARAQ